jgi:hypothetical protein
MATTRSESKQQAMGQELPIQPRNAQKIKIKRI